MQVKVPVSVVLTVAATLVELASTAVTVAVTTVMQVPEDGVGGLDALGTVDECAGQDGSRTTVPLMVPFAGSR